MSSLNNKKSVTSKAVQGKKSNILFDLELSDDESLDKHIDIKAKGKYDVIKKKVIVKQSDDSDSGESDCGSDSEVSDDDKK